jgi:CBS domain-containing protein
MKVQDIMTTHVQCCSPSTDLAAAAVMMFEGDCGVLPVLREHQVMGIITDRDIAIALGTRGKRASEIPVGAVMATTLYACAPDDDIHTALKTLRREQVHRLPVIDRHGALQGIVSMNDVVLHAEHAASGKKAPDLTYDDVVSTFKAICEHRHPKVGAEALAAAVG